CSCTTLMSLSSCAGSVLLGGDDPILEGRLALALHHHRGIELVAADRAVPEKLSVLRAHRLGLEAHRVPRGDGLVGRVAVAVLVARGRVEASILEDERVRIARGLAALDEDTFEAAAVEAFGHGERGDERG